MINKISKWIAIATGAIFAVFLTGFIFMLLQELGLKVSAYVFIGAFLWANVMYQIGKGK